MNANILAKKTLEWVSLLAVGFWLGAIHVAQKALSPTLMPPQWAIEVGGYDTYIIPFVVVATALWIGLDYWENELIGETDA